MTTFLVEAELSQVVSKVIQLQIEAQDEEEATSKARAALQDYPDKITVEGIRNLITLKIRHWIPRDIKFAFVRKM